MEKKTLPYPIDRNFTSLFEFFCLLIYQVFDLRTVKKRKEKLTNKKRKKEQKREKPDQGNRKFLSVRTFLDQQTPIG